ncbi:MAG: glycosyltransferase family 4 protein [Phormidium sp.]
MSRVILNVGQNYHIRGGSDRYQFVLAELLQKHGNTVIPFAAASPENKATEWSNYFPQRVNFEHPNLVDVMRFIYSKPAAKAIQQLLQDTHIDIAHLHIYYGQLTASILAPLKKAGVPIVQTLHEYKIVCPVYTLLSNGEICQACQGFMFWKATLKRCNRGSLTRSLLSTLESYLSRMLGSVDNIDHFIAVSHFQRNKIIELGIPAEKVTAVNNFIDASGIQPNSKPGEYFLYFGRLERLKGIFTLVEAASALKETPLLIVGDGEVRQELADLIEQKGWDHIHLLGFKHGEELHQLIRNSICLILPSEWYENCPMSVLESYAFGRPVIGSNIGGIPELIVDNVDGFLVSPGDANALREQMFWMSEHRSEAVEMGNAGRQKVEAQFNAEIHYKKIMDVYKKVL